MYTHYSELCDKEDTNGWWENQLHMATAQLQDLQRWKKEALACRIMLSEKLQATYNSGATAMEERMPHFQAFMWGAKVKQSGSL
jgi:hypothetical protein